MYVFHFLIVDAKVSRDFLINSNFQENGEWCLLLRQGGVSFFRALDIFEHLLLLDNASDISSKYLYSLLSPGIYYFSQFF